MITVNRSKVLEPQKFTLDADNEVWVEIRPATLADESQRLGLFYKGREIVSGIEAAAIEIAIVVSSTNILGENDQPILGEIPSEARIENVTLLLQQYPVAFWEIHNRVLEVNPHWAQRGNA
jgi:hypothetical protein